MPVAGALLTVAEPGAVPGYANGARGAKGSKGKRGKTKHSSQHTHLELPGPTCPGLNEPCTTQLGTACCPDIDPNIVCAGGFLGTLDPICQDCSKKPIA